MKVLFHIFHFPFHRVSIDVTCRRQFSTKYLFICSVFLYTFLPRMNFIIFLRHPPEFNPGILICSQMDWNCFFWSIIHLFYASAAFPKVCSSSHHNGSTDFSIPFSFCWKSLLKLPQKHHFAKYCKFETCKCIFPRSSCICSTVFDIYFVPSSKLSILNSRAFWQSAEAFNDCNMFIGRINVRFKFHVELHKHEIVIKLNTRKMPFAAFTGLRIKRQIRFLFS